RWMESPLSGQRTPPDTDLLEARPALVRIASDHPDPKRRLRGLWAQHALGVFPREAALRATKDSDAFVRAWGIQLALDREPYGGRGGGMNTPIITLIGLAQSDPSPVVRLYLASGLQRLPF